MFINKINIDKTADLAKLIISKSESQLLEQNLNAILRLVDKMNQIDTTHIEPLVYSFNGTQALRKDIVTEMNQRTLLQKNAPQVEAGLYIVPVMIESKE
ncbi:MAG: Asp-tRNA(Asn)/Glu-tRNA(Gln) amidotransferase subunit GatC [Coxiella endosymbiont of Dermacentor nuttalli]